VLLPTLTPKLLEKRHAQGWVDEVYTNLDELIIRLEKARKIKKQFQLLIREI